MNHLILNSLLDVIMYVKRFLIILENQLMFKVRDLNFRHLIMSMLFTVDLSLNTEIMMIHSIWLIHDKMSVIPLIVLRSTMKLNIKKKY